MIGGCTNFTVKLGQTSFWIGPRGNDSPGLQCPCQGRGVRPQYTMLTVSNDRCVARKRLHEFHRGQRLLPANEASTEAIGRFYEAFKCAQVSSILSGSIMCMRMVKQIHQVMLNVPTSKCAKPQNKAGG